MWNEDNVAEYTITHHPASTPALIGIKSGIDDGITRTRTTGNNSNNISIAISVQQPTSSLRSWT